MPGTKSIQRMLEAPPQMVAPAGLQPLNFSKTRRILLLVDLYPLLTLGNPSPYLRAVSAVASRLLSFPPLSDALFAYKFFFSSLSPIRSAAVLPRGLCASSISFNRPYETRVSLSNSLDSIESIADWLNSQCYARASHTVSSLLQLIHDYAWEMGSDDVGGNDFAKFCSNLVILLSPIGQSVHSLADYLELREFDEVFRVVKDTFAVRDIHLCWIDVKCDELTIEGSEEKKDEPGDELVNLKNEIRKMGWGFCSSDLIVLGSALLPFGLIYPKIGVFDFVNFVDSDKRKHRGELDLGILDVNGMPLECKCCDLEFVNLQSLSTGSKVDDIFNALESRDSQSSHVKDSFWVRLGEENIKLRVESVHGYEQSEKREDSREIVLVQECFQELGKNRRKSGSDPIADSVLEMLHGEMGGVVSQNQLPIWQMFLSFLYVKGYWALVSLSRNNVEAFKGRLMPFTTHLAILSIFDADCVSIGDNVGPKLPKIDQNICDTDEKGMNKYDRCLGSQTDTSTSGNLEPQGEGKITKSQRRLYQEMRWSSFCKTALGGSNFDLFELYIVRHYEKSKKLKFLKCWMKQISKVDPCCSTALPGSNSEEISVCVASSYEPSPAQDVAIPVSKSETPKTFFNNLSNRIQQSLESGMDLQTLAEGIVKSSIHWLHHKFDNESDSGDQVKQNSDGSRTEAARDKLVEILLRAPKEMKKIHQDLDPCSSSENLVREYELQILLRMEILRLDVSTMMEESRKQKMLKQICSLLEIIQYLVAGGIHGDISLYDYVERTIRTRYSAELEDIVAKIYMQMDLLPFGDEDESPNLLFNSEDSNQSWRDKCDKNEKHDPNSINKSVSTEGESLQLLANPYNSTKEIGEDEHTRILNEARERRERARRFAPFVGKARDLQRVWAPKQPKAVKCKYDAIPNKSKRKKNRQTLSCSVVCETPMTGNKRTHSRGNNNNEGKSFNDLGNSSCSVAKALFQDN